MGLFFLLIFCCNCFIIEQMSLDKFVKADNSSGVRQGLSFGVHVDLFEESVCLNKREYRKLEFMKPVKISSWRGQVLQYIPIEKLSSTSYLVMSDGRVQVAHFYYATSASYNRTIVETRTPSILVNSFEMAVGWGGALQMVIPADGYNFDRVINCERIYFAQDRCLVDVSKRSARGGLVSFKTKSRGCRYSKDYKIASSFSDFAQELEYQQVEIKFASKKLLDGLRRSIAVYEQSKDEVQAKRNEMNIQLEELEKKMFRLSDEIKQKERQLEDVEEKTFQECLKRSFENEAQW